MEILSIRRQPPGYGRRNVIATFDIALSDHLRLCNLVLHRTPDGRLRTFAPNSHGRHLATFHPELATQITAAAEAALSRSLAANDDRR